MDATTQTPVTPADTGITNPVSLTAKAVEMVKDAMEREGLAEYGIRVGVMGGGCAGFQYSMDFEKEPATATSRSSRRASRSTSTR